jgi:TetR/AcrR family transcriptional regulator, transcriptional repressor for nem operon
MSARTNTTRPPEASAAPPAELHLTRKGRATCERIVAKAAELMFERGVAGTSNEEVQAAAGVSASQLYHYFANKQALVRAVIAHQTEYVVGSQEPLLSDLDSFEALRAWRDAVVGQRRDNWEGGCPIGSLASELADRDPKAREDLFAAFSRWEAAIRDGLGAMRERGELSPDADPDRLALALLAVLQGGLLLSQTRQDTAALEVGLDTVIDRIESQGR